MLSELVKGILLLEDGTYFLGSCFKNIEDIGEIVFNTSMSGYQEIISDPSYKGQIVCFTYPSIGNYGVTSDDDESEKPILTGIITRDYCEYPSNFRAQSDLLSYLKQNEIAFINEIDTRKLVRYIREKGSMNGGIFSLGDVELTEAWISEKVDLLTSGKRIEGANLASGFTGSSSNIFIKNEIAKRKLDITGWPVVGVLDFGIKYSILKQFLLNKIYPIVFAGGVDLASQNEFVAEDLDGYFLSNGPGDPSVVEEGINNIRKILQYGKPIFGICLGHQMLSLALGAGTYKLKFGHHGGNQPVKRQGENSVIITAQNHGFAVEENKLIAILNNIGSAKLEINSNDATVEGFIIDADKKLLSIQYHPEAGPGPNDALFHFETFAKWL